MGFDVTYHPVKAEEIAYWCIDRLPEFRQQNPDTIIKISEQHAFTEDDFRTYLNLLSQIADFPEDAPFELNLGYGCAAVSGMFRRYHYTRNNSLTKFIQDNPDASVHVGSLKYDLGLTGENHTEVFTENYSSGVWLSPEGVKGLMTYLEEPKNREAFDASFPGGQAAVVLQALTEARDTESGMLEATDVIEPNPLDLDSSKSLTKLENCDPAGTLLYQEVAIQQLKDAGVFQ